MKISTLAAGVALSALMITGAVASDLKPIQSLKDDTNYATSDGVVNWTGWYLTGKLGVSKQEYEGSRHFGGEVGKYRNDKKGPDGISGNSDDTVEAVRYEKPGLSWDGVAPFSMESDEGLEGGIEISRMQRVGGGIILEPYLSFNLPMGNENKVGVTYAYDVNSIFQPSGNPAFSNAALGYVEAEKRFDAGAGVVVGFTPISRLYLYGGGGINWGFFNLKGHNDIDPTAPGSPFETSFSDKDNAIGYELKAGGKYALSSRTFFGIEGTYKEWGGLEAGSSRLTDVGTVSSGKYVRAGGRNEIDADDWSIKGTLTIKLSD